MPPARAPSPRRRGGCRARTGIAAASCDARSRSPSTRLAADFSPMRSSAASVGTRAGRVGRRAHEAASTSWSTSFSPSPSMSIARATRNAAAPACAAPQNSPPVQRQSASPSSRAIALPQTGQAPPSWRIRSKGPPRRPAAIEQIDADDLGNHVAGAAHDHRVADTNVLAARLVLVVQRRVGHRHAADEHRLELGHRREPPVRPTWTSMPRTIVIAPVPDTCARLPSAARA
jgi:hypothetical protein